jgi:hypothetical protein
VIANAIGKRAFKRYLDLFLDSLFYALVRYDIDHKDDGMVMLLLIVFGSLVKVPLQRLLPLTV